MRDWDEWLRSVKDARGTVHYIHKVLTDLQQKPHLKKNRIRFNHHFLATKYPAAHSFFISVGFQHFERKGRTGLEISQVDPIIETALQWLAHQLTVLPATVATVTVAELDRSKVKCRCGFFASSGTGLCSQCQKQVETEKRQSSRKHWRILYHVIVAIHRLKQSIRKVQYKTNRCWTCQRNIGLSGIPCVCGYVFCGKHRHTQDHDCEFDHKKAQRAKITRENPQLKRRKR